MARAKQNQAEKVRLHAGRKKGRVREKTWSLLRQTLGTLAGKPQPHGHTQINRNGLNSDVRVNQ